jgi:hypothetical protein
MAEILTNSAEINMNAGLQLALDEIEYTGKILSRKDFTGNSDTGGRAI